MDATLSQASKILSLFEDAPREQIQDLLESGLLADLRDGNIAGVNRDDFRHLVGLKPRIRSTIVATFTITCEGRKTSELVRLGKYDWTKDWIVDERFPIEPHEPVTRTIEFIECDYDPSSKEVLEELERHGLKGPTYEDALEFGVEHPEQQRKRPHVFLHEAVLGPSGYRFVLALGGDAGYRRLDLPWFGRRWHRAGVFAGVREETL
ncbi:MAG TPA: hypothetical protein VGA53_03945 [Candidatus Paceibacterota bacterium]